MRPSDLNPARWRRIDEVFDFILDHAPEERRKLLRRMCGHDHALVAEVEALLDAHDREEVLELPVVLQGPALDADHGGVHPSRNIGPFRVLREIGRGGMGVVYLAEDMRIGRYVALKVLPPYLAVGREARKRFEAEARAVSTLDHPNIATLYETDETDEGQLYMAFAFYEGETLQARIEQGPLSPRETVEVAIGIARGLSAAHASGIVHRDIKPSNVLLTTGGEVKLLDFGVAKIVGEDVTGDGVRPGTVAYMSPEHVTGETVDGRTDLWSVGVVIREMVTAQRPFQGSDPASVLHAIVHDEPGRMGEPGEGRRGALTRIVDKLLSKSPEGRYRSADELIEDLQALREGKQPVVALRDPPPTGPPSERVRRLISIGSGSREKWAAVALLASVLVGAVVWVVMEASPQAGGGAASRAVESIAVLPLRNLTGDATQEPFVDGIHDALVAELGALEGLRVLSRTSVLRYRDTDRSVPEIAEELGVDAVLEGSVARDGDSLRVTAQLVAASPERHLWAGSRRRSVGDVFEMAGDVARNVAAQLDLAGTPSGGARPGWSRMVDPEAYEAYTLGRFSLEQRSRAGFGQAENYLRRAIEIDPGFAPAYVALAQVYGSAAFFGLRRPAQTLPRVEALVDSALRIDSTLAEAHGIRALVDLYWHWDWDGAERSARRAIELNPSLAGAHRTLSEVHAVRGRLEDALASVRRGSELERFVPFAQFRPVVVLISMDDFDAAVQEARAGIDFFPDFWQGHWLLCQALAGRGDFQRASAACETAVDASGRTPMALGALGFAYALQGRRDAAEQIVDELESRADGGYVGGSYVAMVHGGLGDLDRAFEWLDRAYEERDLTLLSLPHDPFFDPLRTDSRFVDLWERMGLEGRPAQARSSG